MISFDSPSWADALDCAVTLCDTQGMVCYQNRRSVEVNQTVWYDEERIGGLVEFSMELPDEMPHYVRS